MTVSLLSLALSSVFLGICLAFGVARFVDWAVEHPDTAGVVVLSILFSAFIFVILTLNLPSLS